MQSDSCVTPLTCVVAETKARSGTGLPWFAAFIHVLATYGEPSDVASKRRHDWDTHVLDAAHSGDSAADLGSLALTSLFAHFGWRCRHGSPTAIPAGVLVTLTAIAALSFNFSSESKFPAAVHVHIAIGLLTSGLIFLVFPLRIPSLGLAVMGVLVGSSMVHGLSALSFTRPADVLLCGGAVVLVAACVVLVVVAVGGERVGALRRRGFEGLAIGTALFSLGNLSGYQITDDPQYAMSSLFSACVTLLTANAIMRVRDLC